MAHEMTSDELRDFLAAGTRTAKLAVVRKDGSPSVTPVWFVLDGDDLVFTTGRDTLKARAMRRDPRVMVCVEDDTSPYAFARISGTVAITDDLDEMLAWATRIGGRYMGEDRAEEFGERNAVPEEVLVRLTPDRTTAVADLTAQ